MKLFAPSKDALQPAALWCDCWLCAGALQSAVPLYPGGPGRGPRGGDALCWLCSLSLAMLNSVGKLAVDSWTCSSSAAWGKGRTRSCCFCCLLYPAQGPRPALLPVHLHRESTDLPVLCQSRCMPGAAPLFPHGCNRLGQQ